MRADGKKICERIGSLAVHWKKSRAALAEKLGCSPSYLSQVLKARRGASPKFLAALRREMGWDLHWILLGDDDPGAGNASNRKPATQTAASTLTGTDAESILGEIARLVTGHAREQNGLVHFTEEALKAAASGKHMGAFAAVPLRRPTTVVWPPKACKQEDIERLVPVDRSLLGDAEQASCVAMPDDSMSPICEKGETLVIDHGVTDPAELQGHIVVAKTADGKGISVGRLAKWDSYRIVPERSGSQEPLPLDKHGALLGRAVCSIAVREMVGNGNAAGPTGSEK